MRQNLAACPTEVLEQPKTPEGRQSPCDKTGSPMKLNPEGPVVVPPWSWVSATTYMVMALQLNPLESVFLQC